MAGGLPVGLNETRPTQSLRPGDGLRTKNPIKRICGPGFRMERTAPGPGNPARLAVGGRHQLLPRHLLWPELCLACECGTGTDRLQLVAAAPEYGEFDHASAETWAGYLGNDALGGSGRIY